MNNDVTTIHVATASVFIFYWQASLSKLLAFVCAHFLCLQLSFTYFKRVRVDLQTEKNLN